MGEEREASVSMNDQVTHWLTTVTAGERYWDLAGKGDAAERGRIEAVNELGFLATVTGTWNGEAQEFDDCQPETVFRPWTAVSKIGPQET